eukprot:4797782-Alexandrium_andersonii.AAC.1
MHFELGNAWPERPIQDGRPPSRVEVQRFACAPRRLSKVRLLGRRSHHEDLQGRPEGRSRTPSAAVVP